VALENDRPSKSREVVENAGLENTTQHSFVTAHCLLNVTRRLLADVAARVDYC